MSSNEQQQPKTPEEVIELVESLEEKCRERALHLARLKMWAQVAQQGLTPDEVRAFSKREADIRDSYQRWLKCRGSLAEHSMQMGRMTFGMRGSPGPEDPDWVRNVHKSRSGSFVGRVYTVAILNDGSEVRLDPPIVAPGSDDQ